MMTETVPNLDVPPSVLNTPEQIALYRLCALRSAVKLEVLGMKRRGRPATVIAREILGLRRSVSKAKVLEVLTQAVENAMAAY